MPSVVSAPSVVYELFTSQGCSSCPPANAQIDGASREPGVLALSYGVTYWDYLGWKDTFAKPEFTERQRRYVRALGARGPYTPQIVVNGRVHASRIEPWTMAPLESDLLLAMEQGELTADGVGEAVLVSFTPGRQSVPVKRGENGGRTVEVTNVVAAVESVVLPHIFTPEPDLAYALLKHGADMSISDAAVWMPQGSQGPKTRKAPSPG